MVVFQYWWSLKRSFIFIELRVVTLKWSNSHKRGDVPQDFLIILVYFTHSFRVLLVEQAIHTLLENRSSLSVFSSVRVAQSLLFCAMFCRLLLSFYFWPLYCLSFFNLRLLIIPFGIFKFFLQMQKCYWNISINGK